MIKIRVAVLCIILLGCTDTVPSTKTDYQVSHQDMKDAYNNWIELREQYLIERGWKKKGFVGQWYHPDLGTENTLFSAIWRWREVHGDD